MRRSVAAFVWLIAASTLAGSIFVAVQAVSESDGGAVGIGGAIAWSVLPAAFAVTAAVIVAKQPGNVIGWLMLVTGVGYLSGVLVERSVDGLAAAPATIRPGLLAALAYDNFSWVLLIFPVFHLLLVFPTGRLLSPRWRWVVALEVVMILVMVGLSTFIQPASPFSGLWTVHNPVGFIPATILEGSFMGVWTAGLVLVTVSGLVSQILRYRRSSPVERVQIKWLLFAVIGFAVVYSVSAVVLGFEGGGWLDLAMPISIVSIAAAIAVAILRYRLFDIDRIISRTVGYAVVVAMLSLAYFGSVTIITALLPAQDALAVAGSTLAAAALFNPLRRRIQSGVERRFNRAGYQAQVVADRFASTLREPLTQPQLVGEWAGAVTESLEPSTIGVWLKTRS